MLDFRSCETLLGFAVCISSCFISSVCKSFAFYLISSFPDVNFVRHRFSASYSNAYKHGLSRLMLDDLHWLVIPQRVQSKLAVTVHRCLRHRAPKYLADHCVPVSEVPGRQHLWSARCDRLSVLLVRSSSFGTHIWYACANIILLTSFTVYVRPFVTLSVSTVLSVMLWQWTWSTNQAVVRCCHSVYGSCCSCR